MLMSDLIEYSHTYAKTIWGFCQKDVISDKVTDSESFTFKNNNNKNIDDNNKMIIIMIITKIIIITVERLLLVLPRMLKLGVPLNELNKF